MAGKCTLAARVDGAHAAPNGALGIRFKAEVDKRIENFLEPPETKKVLHLTVEPMHIPSPSNLRTVV